MKSIYIEGEESCLGGGGGGGGGGVVDAGAGKNP